MAKLGFLGLGLMGYPMARNLLRAGHEVALWSNTAEKARKLASDEGGRFCETPRQVAEHAECIFVCVGNTGMSKEVILGGNGVIAGAKPNTVVVDASTIGPPLGVVGIVRVGWATTGAATTALGKVFGCTNTTGRKA